VRAGGRSIGGWGRAVAEVRVILIRHGETEWNREGRVQGYHADSPLTEAGRGQARALAERFARERVDALYASDTGRARRTASPIGAATGLRVIHDAALRERNYGGFEGHTFAEVERDFPEEYERFCTRDPNYVPPGGESATQFRDRVMAAFERIVAETSGRRVAVVTHGGVLGIVYRHAMDVPLEARRGYTLANASLNQFRYAAGRWLLETWGDVAHLPAEPDER
jgi:probable phosphoglycerate mutase